jgi:hypothetical protein
MFSLRNQQNGIVLQDAKEREILNYNYGLGVAVGTVTVNFPVPIIIVCPETCYPKESSEIT